VFSPALAWMAVMAPPADGPTLSADRPGFSESTRLVPKGFAVLEAGAILARPEGASTLQVGSSVLRWGALRELELRVILPSVVWSDRTGAVDATDSGLGLKVGAKGERWALSVVPTVFFPTGSDGATAREVTGRINANAEVTVLDSWYAGAAGFLVSTTAPVSNGVEQRLFGAWVVHSGVTVGPILTLFGQVFARRAEGEPEWGALVGGGAVASLGPRWQLDFELNFGANEAVEDITTSLGFAVLF
jgi:hypothetical protein